jgi:hypothetical protein
MPNIEPYTNALATVNQGRQRLPVTVLRSGAVAAGFYTCRDRFGNDLNIHAANLMPIEPVPLRFRRAAFERYAHVIGAALRAYPSTITVDPSPLTAESYAQPLRDAIRAKQQHGYIHPDINEDLFRQHASNLVVRIGAGVITAGGTAGPNGKHVVVGRVREAAPAEQDTLVDPACLDPLCLMLTERRLTPPPSFVVAGLTPQQIESFEARYDVAFVPHDTQAGMHRLVPPLSLNITPTPTT